VEALVTPRAESPPWALTDAWGARDVGGVLRAAERMLDRTGDPVSRTLPRLVGGLTKHVRNARAAQRLEEQGLSSAEAASRLGMKPYPAQKLYAQVRKVAY
jgi:DNA polymerase III delta subunit